MSEDADYMAFLEKANQDPSAGGSAPAAQSDSNKVQLKTLDGNVSTVPKILKEKTDTEEWIYVSDADEPFVPVSLKLKGGELPDERGFAELISHPFPQQANISILDITKWDPHGQYKEVVKAVREAVAGSDVIVYSVEHGRGGSRVEYWVVGVDKESGRLIGVKALSIES